jgi:hypothetical protein
MCVLEYAAVHASILWDHPHCCRVTLAADIIIINGEIEMEVALPAVGDLVCDHGPDDSSLSGDLQLGIGRVDDTNKISLSRVVDILAVLGSPNGEVRGDIHPCLVQR